MASTIWNRRPRGHALWSGKPKSITCRACVSANASADRAGRKYSFVELGVVVLLTTEVEYHEVLGMIEPQERGHVCTVTRDAAQRPTTTSLVSSSRSSSAVARDTQHRVAKHRTIAIVPPYLVHLMARNSLHPHKINKYFLNYFYFTFLKISFNIIFFIKIIVLFALK